MGNIVADSAIIAAILVMDQLTSLLFFTRAVQHQSFTAAARQLATSPSSVSRAVQQLEERLGTRLLNRTTRRIALTEDGVVFYDYCRQILSELEEAELALSKARAIPTGTLRLDLTVSFGRLYIAPMLPKFASQYPELKLEVSFNDRYVDVIEEGLDAVVRIGTSPDSQLIIHPLATARFVVCGSLGYLQRYGEPRTLEDLQQHRCLSHVFPYTRQVRPWVFQHEGKSIQLPIQGQIYFNYPEALLEAAVADGGLVQLFHHLVAPAIAQGQLKPVLESYAAPGLPISVIYPQKRHLSAKVRAIC